MTNLSDTFTNDNLLNIETIFLSPPWASRPAGEIHHIAFTIYYHSTVSIENIIYIFTTDSGKTNIVCFNRNTIIKKTLSSVNLYFTVICITIFVEVIKNSFNPLITSLVFVIYKIHYCIIDFIKTIILIIRLNYTIFIKGIHLTINKMRAYQCHPIFIIRSIIVTPTIQNSNTINVSLAVGVNTIEQFATSYASQLTGNNLVYVSSYRNNSTPINYRIANCAISSTSVTCFGTSCSLIIKHYWSMNVCCASLCLECRIRECCLKFSINAEFLIRECADNIRSITVNISNLTHVNINLNVVWPETIGVPICFRIISFNLNIGIKINYTNRK